MELDGDWGVETEKFRTHGSWRTNRGHPGRSRQVQRQKQDLGTSLIGVQGGPLWGPGIRQGRSVQTIDWGFVQLLGLSSPGSRRGRGRGRGSGQELLGFGPCGSHQGPMHTSGQCPPWTPDPSRAGRPQGSDTCSRSAQLSTISQAINKRTFLSLTKQKEPRRNHCLKRPTSTEVSFPVSQKDGDSAAGALHTFSETQRW